MITIYTSPTCPYCNELKELLTTEGIEYNDVNVDLSENQDEFNKILEFSKAQEIPIIKIDKQLLVPNVSFHTIKESVEITKKILG